MNRKAAKENARKWWMDIFENVYPRCKSMFCHEAELAIINMKTLRAYDEDGLEYTLQVAPSESEDE